MADEPIGELPRCETRMLSWKAVKELTGLSRTTAWRLQKTGEFPTPVAISPGRVGWRESEIARWQASRTPRSAAPVACAAPGRRPAPPPQAGPERPLADAAPPQVRPAPATRAPSRRNSTRPSDQITFDF